jgi:hypothetical protein
MAGEDITAAIAGAEKFVGMAHEVTIAIIARTKAGARMICKGDSAMIAGHLQLQQQFQCQQQHLRQQQ